MLRVKQRWTRRALTVLLMGLVGLAQQIQAADDLAGSEDLSILQRYPNSWIVDYSRQIVPEYRLATGKMKKINGVISPQFVQYLAGDLTRITYRLPAGRSSKEAFEHFQAQFGALSAQVLFRCRGRGCGDSNQWANFQFGIPRLYGIDREQYYQALKIEQPGRAPVHLAFYTVKRGNKRVYVQLDLIDTQSRAAASEVVSADGLIERLRRQQRVYSAAGKFDDTQLMELATLLAQTDLRLQLVGHSNLGGSVQQQREDSVQLALTLQQRLLALGVEPARTEVFGLGALAPAYDDQVPMRRVELLLITP